MKTLKLLTFILFSKVSISQEWGGSTTSTTGTIYRSGRVGIGTVTSPTTQLHLQTSALIPLGLERTGTHANMFTIAFSNTPITGLTFGTGSTIFQSNNPLGVSDMVFINGTLSTSPRFVLKSNGNFGFGTDNPNLPFHIHNKSFKLSGSGSYGHMVFSKTETSNDWGIEYNTANVGKEGLNFWKPFGSGGGYSNYNLFLGNNNKVGIGTNEPTATLTINGNCLIGDVNTQLNGSYKLYVQTGILTEKLKISVRNSVNWADYVFDPSYKMLTINELESYVKMNRHLPNVPSAKQVEEDGVDVIDMTNRLLEKVEELTLYIIEQNKKIEELEKKVKSIEK